jgi:ATP phosphoribosyltransferase
MSRLILALPSKGRLEELSREVFGKAGMQVDRAGGARSYAGSLVGSPDVVVRFLPAGEIAKELIKGTIDIGITGTDLIHETIEDGAKSVEIAIELGFGKADAVIAIPDAWIDVTHVRDLADVASDFREKHGRWLRIATKYIHLTRAFLAEHGIAQYKIVQSVGATEAAPSAGAADLIVDITSTGATLRANGLRILEDGVILKSQACLIVSKTADWSEKKQEQKEQIISAIKAIF